MTVSTPWNKTPSSDAKLNLMTNISDTGANLAALDKTKHKIVICTATGSGYTLDHPYLFTDDGASAIDLRSTASHAHVDSSTGGELAEIANSNPTYYDLILTKAPDLYEPSWASPVYWIKTVTSTGSVTNDTDGTTGERSIKLDSGATSGAAATINYPHLQLDWSKTAMFQAKIRIGTASSLAFHVGVGADDITAADSNTQKIQCELCTTTNNNFWLRTGSGSANTASDTSVAFGTSRTPIRIKHYPSVPKTMLYVGSGSELTKTTNIPTTSTTADNNIVKFSLKNSTAASRTMFCYGARLQYYVSDEWV